MCIYLYIHIHVYTQIFDIFNIHIYICIFLHHTNAQPGLGVRRGAGGGGAEQAGRGGRRGAQRATRAPPRDGASPAGEGQGGCRAAQVPTNDSLDYFGTNYVTMEPTTI